MSLIVAANAARFFVFVWPFRDVMHLRVNKKYDFSVLKQPPEIFCKKGVLKNFGKITRKNLYQSLFSNKITGRGLQPYWKRGSGTVVFLWILQNCKEHLFYRTPSVATSECLKFELVLTTCKSQWHLYNQIQQLQVQVNSISTEIFRRIRVS